MGVRKITKHGSPRLVIDFWYTDTSGTKRRFRKTADVQTMTAAKAEEQRLRLHAATHGEPYSSRPPCMTLGDFVTHWATWSRSHHKPSTRERYEALLGQGIMSEFGHLRLDEINADRVTTYATSLLTRGVEAWPHISLVSTMLKAAVALGHLSEMPSLPSIRRDKRKLPDCPDTDEIDAMLQASQGWLRVAIALAAYAGLRSGEVRALEVRDIDFRQSRLLIRRSISADEITTTKSDEERIVPIAPQLEPILREACKGKSKDARVVATRNGTAPHRQHILSRLSRVQQRHGLQHRSFHSIRHYFCTSLLRRGADIELVRVVAGHQDVETTMRYLHARYEDASKFMGTIKAPELDGVLN
jgi:integrase